MTAPRDPAQLAELDHRLRSLPWSGRARIARAGRGLGSLPTRIDDVELAAYFARRELARWPVLVTGFALAAIPTTALLVQERWWLGSAAAFVFSTIFVWGVFAPLGNLWAVRRLNRRLVAEGRAPFPPGSLPRLEKRDTTEALAMALALMAGVALAVAWDSRPEQPSPVLAEVPSLAIADLPERPPAELVDGAEPGSVPAPVAAAASGPVIGARATPLLMVGADEPCDGGQLVESDRAPAIVGPRSHQVALLLSDGAGGQQVVTCEYDVQGRLGRRSIAPLAITEPGAAFSESWSALPGHRAAPAAMHLALRVPDEAAWALVDQGRWTLALPVAGMPAVSIHVRLDLRFDVEGRPTVDARERITFVDGAGRTLVR